MCDHSCRIIFASVAYVILSVINFNTAKSRKMWSRNALETVFFKENKSIKTTVTSYI